jgi:hypothetical protein
MLSKFLKAVSRNWSSLVTGGASIPLTILAFFAPTPLQRTAWATFAIMFFLIASFRTWMFEYLRAEEAEAKLKTLRPWVVIDGYSSGFAEDEEDRSRVSLGIRSCRESRAGAGSQYCHP